ncbi:MAG: right-handed parallel beta-helix repeat-containing protein [Roseiflexaceae bacterium]|nr:right-handed parallel beta-helix repeat-containing protein [Roseiflexaceae bacterium]
MSHIVPYRSLIGRGFALPVAVVLACTGLISGSTGHVALAASPVPVTYDALNKVVYIGEASLPEVPKIPISLPEVDQELSAQGFPDLIGNQGTVWTLTVDTVVNQSARLEVTSASVSELRLDSTSGTSARAGIRLVIEGGAVKLDGVKVHSWAGGSADTDPVNGRSSIEARAGGRLDISSSEVSHLGRNDEEPGLAWRDRAVADIQNTSSTGLIKNSNIHDNYIGLYLYNVYGLMVENTDIHTNSKHGVYLTRGSIENSIVGGEIYDNAEHGVVFNRGSDDNTVGGSSIYNNSDGIVVFQSERNLIEDNVLQRNTRGIRINATQTLGDTFDSPSTVNTIRRNQIIENDQYGIYLYERADKTVIENNTISDNGASGINIKTNDNTIRGNIINANGEHGISFDGVARENLVTANQIYANVADGVQIRGTGLSTDNRNKITNNSIAANGRKGINLTDGGNKNLAAPIIAPGDPQATSISGTAVGAKTVEIYRDTGGQGKVYKGSAAVANDNWSFTLPAGDNVQEGAITALAIDGSGNTSPFGGNVVGGSLATYTIGAGVNGDTTVFISGPGANVTLPNIRDALKVISPTAELLVLEDATNKVWQSNVSLFVNRGVTLTLTTDTVAWLKLRSQSANIQLTRAEAGEAAYNYKSFVSLRTYNGVVTIDGVKITSWDPVQNTVDTDVSNGRSYLLAKYNARMDIKNADLSYLGSADGESYGVSWRDINSSEQPGVLLTRVTGQVLNSTFSNNYYGIYTYQARDMVFRGNKFHHNIGYGFDPHDFSTRFLVENNEAFENGNHGFIISRGCNNFVFRGNKSYNNRYTVGTDIRRAHGFMLDPGSPNSRYPQEPSFLNLLENNEAWGNDGYGLRVVGSISNTIQLNTFRDNLQGMTLEQGSTGNIVKNNTISGSGLYGMYLFGGSDRTTITGNTVTKSGKHGIYIKTGGNTIAENTVSENGSVIDGAPNGSGIATLRETDLATARADLVLPNGDDSLARAESELFSAPAATSEVNANVINKNTVTKNVDEGIELKGATGTQIVGNTVQGNGSNGIYLASGTNGSVIKKNEVTGNLRHGIRANGGDVLSNTWTENQVFENGAGGIITTSSANNGIRPPVLVRNETEVTGTAAPGTIIELYSDMGGQGRYYETRVTVAADGTFRVQRSWRGNTVNATATDANGNTSGFTYNVAYFVATNELYLPMAARR